MQLLAVGIKSELLSRSVFFLHISFFFFGHLLTGHQVQKRPVAECGAHLDCRSCLSARDPYCGWCVLQGRSVKKTTLNLLPFCDYVLTPFALFCLRCGQHWECQRGSVQDQWIWSFKQTQQCLHIHHLSLYNISHGEKSNVCNGE